METAAAGRGIRHYDAVADLPGLEFTLQRVPRNKLKLELQRLPLPR